MRRRSAFIIGVLLSALVTAGCMATPEERLAEGVSEARTAFEKEPPETNEIVGQTELYLPGGYDIERPVDGNDLLITKGRDSYILSVNPNESPDSKLFYDLLKADADQQWTVDKTFEQHDRFGFVALKNIAENQMELTVSTGGAKMTTISEKSAVPGNMEWMMETVRSIKNKTRGE